MLLAEIVRQETKLSSGMALPDITTFRFCSAILAKTSLGTCVYCILTAKIRNTLSFSNYYCLMNHLKDESTY